MSQAPCFPLLHLQEPGSAGSPGLMELSTGQPLPPLNSGLNICSTQQGWGPGCKPPLPCPWETNFRQVPACSPGPCQASCTVRGFSFPVTVSVSPESPPRCTGCTSAPVSGLLPRNSKDDTVSLSRTHQASPSSLSTSSGWCPSPAACNGQELPRQRQKMRASVAGNWLKRVMV